MKPPSVSSGAPDPGTELHSKFELTYNDFMKAVRSSREREDNQAKPRSVASASKTDESSGAAASIHGNEGKFT